MGDIVDFCETTKTKVSEQIKETDEALKNKTPKAKYDEISKALDENQESRKKNLLYRKNKKFYRLKYQPNQQGQPIRAGRTPPSDDEENQSQRQSRRERSKSHRERSSSRNKPRTFADVLKGQNQTNHQRTDKYSNQPRPNPNREDQINKLQRQIDELRNQRNHPKQSPTPKNLNHAPPTGAETTQDIVKLINTTMLTLTAFASRLENPDSLQIPREM